MTTDELRQRYLDFFKSSPRNHKELTPAPLVLKDDPTTLFTSAGMQPLVPYLMGKSHPKGQRLVDSQPCLRSGDIEEVGDYSHTTFFEMLGNWSLGDYFKAEQLPWFWEFLTKKLKLPTQNLWITIFEGYKNVPKDKKSYEIWKKLGVPEERIRFYGTDKNWWSRAGTPDQMPEGEIGGPSSEVFYEFTNVKHDPKFGKKCHPNCDCGRFLEIGNSVFIEYKKEGGNLIELPQKNVDFGGGLERLVAAVNNDPDVFQIDVFQKIIQKIEAKAGKNYEDASESFRIITDHLRASEALIAAGVEPGNKLQGYVLRRLIRRSAIKMRRLKGSLTETDLEIVLGQGVIKAEVGKFIKTLEKGLKEIEKIKEFTPEAVFELYQSYGFPLEITLELLKEKGQKVDLESLKEEVARHQEVSRAGAKKKFKI